MAVTTKYRNRVERSVSETKIHKTDKRGHTASQSVEPPHASERAKRKRATLRQFTAMSAALAMPDARKGLAELDELATDKER